MAVNLTHLTPRRQRFIAYMLIHGHERGGALKAYGLAGYKTEGSLHADINVAKLLKEPDIASALAAAQHDAAERFEIKQDRILRELALLAFSDISHYKMDAETGEFIVNPDEDVAPVVTRAISSVEYITTTDGEITTRRAKLKLWDKNNALTLLMKYLGMLVDRNLNVNVNAKMTLDQAREIIQGANQPSAADTNNLDLPFQRSQLLSVDEIAELPPTEDIPPTWPDDPA